MSGEAHIPYIPLEIPSNFRCGIFILNMPPRDDDSLAIDLGMFGLGSPAPILGMVDDWTNYGSDRVGMYGSGSDTMLSYIGFQLKTNWQ
ncbi:unnamed protein product [Microthlaspi erraticum]|uniref:Uncharacterized protein n=1 Tax=Microthlaspi erraticum TaxID=1685480 RepID=A0A6D2KDG4_9BRAS|nr:unnamed protein product [Microthlaspi erraticum]